MLSGGAFILSLVINLINSNPKQPLKMLWDSLYSGPNHHSMEKAVWLNHSDSEASLGRSPVVQWDGIWCNILGSGRDGWLGQGGLGQGSLLKGILKVSSLNLGDDARPKKHQRKMRLFRVPPSRCKYKYPENYILNVNKMSGLVISTKKFMDLSWTLVCSRVGLTSICKFPDITLTAAMFSPTTL